MKLKINMKLSTLKEVPIFCVWSNSKNKIFRWNPILIISDYVLVRCSLIVGPNMNLILPVLPRILIFSSKNETDTEANIMLLTLPLAETSILEVR